MTLARTALALVLAAGFSVAAAAQDSHDAHHPAGDQPQAAATAAPSSDAADNAQSGGMMCGPGMMRGGGMDAAGMMPMMQMMANMMGPAGMSEMVMPGMDMADRVEGRIAFLKTELKITDAQAKPWDAFAQSLRDNAKKLGGMRSMMGRGTGGATLAQRLDQQEQWYSARLDGIKSLKASFTPLYAALSDEQRKTADQLLPTNLGLMPMMAMPMGMMSMGGQFGGRMPNGITRGGKP